MGNPAAERLGVDDLTWSEVADAVWLASATQNTWRKPTATQRTEPDQEQSQDQRQPLLRADTPAPDLPETPDVFPENGLDDPIESNELPLGQPAEPEFPAPSGGDGRRAHRDTQDRRDDEVPRLEVPRLPPADLASVPPPTRPLRDSADIVRALRPLKRKVLSWHEDEAILNEDATAEQAVQDGLWWPVTKPGTTCWLDLTLVVDASPSMALWQSTVTAFVSLSQRLGAFRTIQLRLLDTHRSAAGSPPIPVLRGGTPATPARGPAELLDPSGRRIVLVLTDGVGECWREDRVSPLLALWGGAMPVGVVHLLPQRLWERDGLALHRARLTVPGPLRPNRHWQLELPDAWLGPDPTAAVSGGVVPVPVLELDARWLGWWARLVTGGHPEPADATVLLTGTQARETVPPKPATPGPSAHEQVMSFLNVASPAAFRLATLLAAVPVSLPVARLVQAELVPESGPDHLAEVFTSGLLRPSGIATGGRGWDTVTFDVLDAVREELLSGARRSETAHVVRLVTERLGDQTGALRHFREALDDPDSTPDPELTADTAHHVTIERAVMRALSGPYLSRADRLHAGEREHPIRSASADPPRAGVADNDTISRVTDRADLAREPTRPLTPVPGASANDAEPLGETAVVDTFTATHSGPLTALAPLAPHERQADDPPPVWGNVPPRNLTFTGRGELLDQLSERLTAGGATAVLPAALHGMGGIGKTQMAVEYIYRHLPDYDVIWWIQATQQAQIRAGLTELAQRLRLPRSAEANTAVPEVREALRLGRPYRKWLLVFDSAESPEMVRPFFPTNGPGEILITSRNPDWAGIARPLEVAVFKREESKELLRRRGPEINDDEADRLAETLGDLPLAIEQAAAWRAETGMPVHEYLRLFDEKVAEILDTSATTDYEVSVAAAWNVSFDELRTRNPAAHQLLQVCAFCAPEPISRSLFTGVRGVSISPELDAALRDPIQLSRAIRDINRYGLAKIDHRNNTLQLHRLVQLVLRNRMTPQRQAEMCHGAHMLLANLDPNDPASSRQWLRYQDVLPHAYTAKVIECEDPWVRQLVINLMRFLYQWGDHDEACRLAKRAFDEWSEKLGETDPQTLQTARLLGFYLWSIGQYAEAAEINQRNLELRRQVSGEDSEETLSTKIAVVADLKAKGDFAAARALSEEVYQKAKALFGDDDPITLTAAHSHAISLRFTGEYRTAYDLDEQTYRRRVEILGNDHIDTFSTLNGLILDRREAGDYLWAHAELEKVAERARELFGDDKAPTLRRFSYLCVAKRKAGDHQGALKMSAQVLDRFRLRYGDDHPSSLASALGHSIDLRHAGNLQESRSLGEQTFDRYRRNMGERHPHTLCAAVDLAVTLRMLGDVAGARQLDERSLEQFRMTLGPDHPHAIVCAINLASNLAALGEPEAALVLGTESRDRAERVLGVAHPTTLAATLNLVLDLRALGRQQEAETKYAEVLTGYRRVLGEGHPATVAAASGLRADCDIDTLPL